MEGKIYGVDDSDIEASSGDIRKNVREILDHLVSHFGQAIHAKVILNSYSKEKTTVLLLSSTINGSKKDQLEQQEREYPPIVQLWLDRLLLSLTSDGDAESLATILYEWIHGYERCVRPHIFLTSSKVPAFDEQCIPLLKNYELVLSTLLLKSIGMEEKQSTVSGFLSEKSFTYATNILLRAINLFCTDVTLLTVDRRSDKTKDDAKQHLRRNEGIPTLLQILGNTLEIQRQMISNDGHSRDRFKSFVLESFASLRQCAVTILGFDGLNGDENMLSVTNLTQSASASFLPHILSPSLSKSGACRNDHLTLVKRILEQIEMSTSNDAEKSNARKYLESALRADSLFYNDTDDDYWQELLSTSFDFFTAGWIDSNAVNMRGTLRIVQSIWRSMASLLSFLSKGAHNQNKDDLYDGVNSNVTGAMEMRELQAFVLMNLGGPDQLLRDARAHFFGRNTHGMEDLSQRKSKSSGNNEVDTMQLSSVEIKMGRRVTRTKNDTNLDGRFIDAPIYETVPFRIAGAMNILKLLLIPELMNVANDASKETVLENIFPICAALLDSKNSGFAALGAAGFLRTFDTFARQGMEAPSTPFGSDGKIVNGVAWTNFAENTWAVLERALQSNRDHGHLIVAIGRAQSRLTEIMLAEERQPITEGLSTNKDRNEVFRRRRRIASEQWLSKLERSLYHPVTERQHLELLLGGVIPFLSQHAMDEVSEADGMEVGRLGLASLLPMTTNVTTRVEITEEPGAERIARKAQMASLVALINLMFAAHPIMPCHGGKIISHLLLAAASTTPYSGDESDSENEQRENPENDPTMHSIKSMAILVAGIAMIVCQSRFASQVLESIENDCEQYEQNLLSLVSEVRQVAAGLAAIT